ncbi:MAG: hypothetical protein JO091_01515 [Acidobacteriaceae bacterium]|nr:hypothetical protein [Acidobacteriaceae bacterium]
MLPSELKAGQFSGYQPQARQIAMSQVTLLQQLPLAFVPLLLRELIAYDWKFPAERKELDQQFAYLSSLSPEELRREMAPFASLRLSPELERPDWVNAPVQFSEQLSAHLWATHQLDAFRTASIEYVHKLNAANPPEAASVPRLGIVTIGQGVTETRYRLFRKLRPHGVYFRNVQPHNGHEILYEAVAARAAAHPNPFGHWYIDGSGTRVSGGPVTHIAYGALESVRSALMAIMRKSMQPGGGGPEVLRTTLAQMRPDELGFKGTGDEAILDRFQVSILTEGSGTQLFSTTFVQWSAREALRRAQPVTLMARFTPRRREPSMRELLSGMEQQPRVDPQGSLIDADMGAYYTWINQQRLAGAEHASFLVWFENHAEALAIAPSLGRGVENTTPVDLRELLSRMTPKSA